MPAQSEFSVTKVKVNIRDPQTTKNLKWHKRLLFGNYTNYYYYTCEYHSKMVANKKMDLEDVGNFRFNRIACRLQMRLFPLNDAFFSIRSSAMHLKKKHHSEKKYIIFIRQAILFKFKSPIYS